MKNQSMFALRKRIILFIVKPFGVVESHFMRIHHQRPFNLEHATWEVIDTPGHAFDHQSFLNRDTGQLFTGDLFVQVHTKLLLSNESIPTIIESLEKVLTYDFDEVFCQHAGFVREWSNCS